MSQSQALLRARLDSGASASCSGRPHISPPHAASAARRLGARHPSWAPQDTAQRPAQHAAQRAHSGVALRVCAEVTQHVCRTGSECRTSRGASQRCRARTRFAEEEEPSEEEDLDALVVEDSAGGSLAQLSLQGLRTNASATFTR